MKNFNTFVLFLSIFFFSKNLNGQVRDSLYSINREECKEGIKTHNLMYFNHFAILEQDTILLNKFSIPDTIADLTFPSMLIDSILLVKCEEKLARKNTDISYCTTKNRKPIANLRKYIRLYIGYLDTIDNELKVVVQFVTKKEYRLREAIYRKELFLVVGQKRLRFCVIPFKNDEL